MDEIDVVVAGAGAAGLAAALAAAQNGASTLVVEASRSYRATCNTVQTAGMIPAAGTRWQREAGILDDSPDRFFADVEAKTKGTTYASLARRLTVVSAPMLEWLVGATDLEVELATDFDYPGHSRQRCHSPRDRRGGTLHTALVNAVGKRDEVHFVAPASLQEVYVSSEGSVEGVAIGHGDQGVETVQTGRVVLASGGYAGKPELVARYAPNIAGALYFGSQWNTGDALGIVARMGGDVGYLDAYQGYGAISTRLGIMVNWPLAMHGGIIVNQAGSRFGDETSGYSEFAELVEAQSGRTAWMVFDREVAGLCQRFPDFRELERSLDLNWSADAGELAEKTEIDEQALAATLEQAARAAAGADTDLFGRRNWERMLSFPLAAVEIRGALFHSQGGALVDGQANVLRGGSPVPGLYAAGGAAAGISGDGPSGYMAGNGLLCALGLGWLAGCHAGGRPVENG